jgi:preprotein translocase subunit SecD
MNTIADLLRQADPLRDEPEGAGHERDRRRRAVLAAASHGGGPVASRPRRLVTVVAMVGAALITAVVIGSHAWLHGTVDLQAAVRFEIRLAEEDPEAGLQQVRVANTGRTVYLHPEIIVGNDDVANAGLVQGDAASRFGVAVTFNAAGARKMRLATANHLGKPLAVLIDGDVVIAPVLRGPIDTSAVISGGYTRSDAERIVNGIALR